MKTEPETEPEDYSMPDQSGVKERIPLTKEQLVNPPRHLRGPSLAKWLEEDLIAAVGPEWIDNDGSCQPFSRPKRVITPKEKSKPLQTPQGELF